MTGKNLVTPFGMFLRRLRTSEIEKQNEMAKKLGVSAAYLSAVELGKREVPPEWPAIIKATYGLSGDEVESMNISISNSLLSVKADLRGKTKIGKALIVLFFEKHENLSQEQKNKILLILREK